MGVLFSEMVVARDFDISLQGAARLYLLMTCLAPLALYLVLRWCQRPPDEIAEIPIEDLALPDLWNGDMPPEVRRKGGGERKP